MAYPATTSEPRLLVLLVLRLRSAASVSAITGWMQPAGAGPEPVRAVSTILDDLADGGFVSHRDGVLAGWMLTPAGRVALNGRLAEELVSLRPEDVAVIRSSYAEFLAANQPLLRCCTAWQVRDGAVNDHADAVHDAAVIAELRTIDRAIRPVAERLSSVLARFESYGPRFAEALRRIEVGEFDFVDRPMIDSYHTIWFELHEHLLATLAIERSTEPVPTDHPTPLPAAVPDDARR